MVSAAFAFSRVVIFFEELLFVATSSFFVLSSSVFVACSTAFVMDSSPCSSMLNSFDAESLYTGEGMGISREVDRIRVKGRD